MDESDQRVCFHARRHLQIEVDPLSAKPVKCLTRAEQLREPWQRELINVMEVEWRGEGPALIPGSDQQNNGLSGCDLLLDVNNLWMYDSTNVQSKAFPHFNQSIDCLNIHELTDHIHSLWIEGTLKSGGKNYYGINQTVWKQTLQS
eukprot:g43073.t1